MPNFEKKKINNIKKGTGISIYLGKKTPDALIDWINSQDEIGPTILKILNLYVSGRLIYIPNIENIIAENKQKGIEPIHSVEVNHRVDELNTDDIEDEDNWGSDMNPEEEQEEVLVEDDFYLLEKEMDRVKLEKEKFEEGKLKERLNEERGTQIKENKKIKKPNISFSFDQ